MAEERERVPRASGTEADTDGTAAEKSEAAPSEASGAEASGGNETEAGDDVEFGDDWFAEGETDLGYWLDDSFELYDMGEAGDWGFDDDEEEELSLLGGNGASAERRMTEASSLIALNEFGLAEGSVHLAGDVHDANDLAALLARVVPTSALLGLLDSEWLRALPELGRVVHIRAGDTLFEEGDDGDSLFLLLAGGMRAEILDRETGDPVRITTVRPGDFFGEAALLSDAVRSATVRAVADSVGIELESEAVLTLVENQPSVIKLLMRFFRARMVGAVVQTASFFQKCSSAERKELITRFRLREVAPDTPIVRAGDTVDGLYVVLDGDLSVVGPDEKVMWRMCRGDVFGERSLLDGFPATTGLRADTRAWLLRMPRSEFLEAACRHPHLLEHIAALANERPGGEGPEPEL